MKRVRTFVPRNVLKELLARPGGKDRDEAIAAACEQVEMLREKSLEALDLAIDAIEAAARGSVRSKLSGEELSTILAEGDRIVNLAGTFGLAHLDAAARSLCDLAHALIESGVHDAEPVLVHARALKLFSPKDKSLAESQAELVLAELARFRAHFGAKPLLGADPC